MFQDNSVTYARGTFRDSAVANFNVTKHMQMTLIQCLQFIYTISQIPVELCKQELVKCKKSFVQY